MLTPKKKKKKKMQVHKGPHKQSKANRIVNGSRVKTEDTTHLGSCSTDMLASSESGSGALRAHLVRVVSLRGQQHICDMHQLLMRPSKVFWVFEAQGEKSPVLSNVTLPYDAQDVTVLPAK